MVNTATKIIFILFFTGVTQLLYGQDLFGSYNLPYPAYKYEEILDKRDPVLQRSLEKIINRNTLWRKLVYQKRMAVALVDLRQADNIKYASINGSHMMYAASLPKIAVLLSAIEAVDEGCLEYTEALQKDLRLMIAKSNNAATTRVIEAIGFDKIAETMTKDKYKLYDINNGGGLWVGKKYAKSGRKKPDPLKGLSHAATVDQVARFYTMLAYEKLVSSEWNEQLMGYLIEPEINHKFVKALKKLTPKVDIYRKSGSWKHFHCDSALVFGEDGRKYILVTLIDDFRGGMICSNLVSSAEQALGIQNVPYFPKIIKDNTLNFFPLQK